jgi:hypothetical protein
LRKADQGKRPSGPLIKLIPDSGRMITQFLYWFAFGFTRERMKNRLTHLIPHQLSLSPSGGQIIAVFSFYINTMNAAFHGEWNYSIATNP